MFFNEVESPDKNVFMPNVNKRFFMRKNRALKTKYLILTAEKCQSEERVKTRAYG